MAIFLFSTFSFSFPLKSSYECQSVDSNENGPLLKLKLSNFSFYKVQMDFEFITGQQFSVDDLIILQLSEDEKNPYSEMVHGLGISFHLNPFNNTALFMTSPRFFKKIEEHDELFPNANPKDPRIEMTCE